MSILGNSDEERKIVQDAFNVSCRKFLESIFGKRGDLELGVASKAANIDMRDFKMEVSAKVHLEVCGASFDLDLDYPEKN